MKTVNKIKPCSKRSVLIVEDEILLNEAYSIVLKKEAFKVVSVFNGEEALEYIRKSTPDIILLDLRMPKMSGLEFLQVLKPKKNYPKLKIIVFSNFDSPKEIEEAYKLGAGSYVLKAWASPKELVKLVNSSLRA